MSLRRNRPTKDKNESPEFKEGVHYYIEDGLFVLTELYHRNRGYCCQSGCRHCPYGFVKPKREGKNGEG